LSEYVALLVFGSSWSQGKHKWRYRTDLRDFPSTAAAIARQCGIIRNEKVDDFTDLPTESDIPIKYYDPEDATRICKSIVLSGKDLNEMKDSQWEKVL
jgi:magnesium-transporting ATPase (P-type)